MALSFTVIPPNKQIHCDFIFSILEDVPIVYFLNSIYEAEMNVGTDFSLKRRGL